MSTVIVRVKRKIDQEPPDVLDVFAKRSRKEDGAECDKDSDIKTTLQFAGTVPTPDSSVIEPIRQAMRKKKLEREYKLHVPETGSEQNRQLRKLAAGKSRYSQVASLRKLETEPNTGPSGEGKQEVKVSSDGLDVVRLIDLEQEISYKNPLQVLEKEEYKAETVTCNGVPMVRERVAQASGESQASAGAEPGYVYDVYYARDQERSFRDVEELFKVEAFREDYMFSEYRGDSDYECHEDEDDSNDEDNWRNDYPEEPDYAPYPDLARDDAEGISHCDLWDQMAQKVNLGLDDGDGALDVYGEDLPALGNYADFKKRVLAEMEDLSDAASDQEADEQPPEDSEGISGLL